MNLYFRALSGTDLPAVNGISQEIWEGGDYILQVAPKWIGDSNRHFYGAFTSIDMSPSSLVGFGCIHWYSPTWAWIEGGRVKTSLQKRGIGLLMAHYAMNYAQSQGARRIQYDTWTENHGSKAIAHKLGFSEKTVMWGMQVTTDRLQFPRDPPKMEDFTPISTDQAFDAYERIPLGPKTEINMGWCYVPLLPSYLLQRPNIHWFQNAGAIGHVIEHDPQPIQEGPAEDELWMVIYGDHNASIALVDRLLAREIALPAKMYVTVFLPSSSITDLIPWGFQTFNSKEDHLAPLSGVVLFELKIADLNAGDL